MDKHEIGGNDHVLIPLGLIHYEILLLPGNLRRWSVQFVDTVKDAGTEGFKMSIEGQSSPCFAHFKYSVV